MKHAGPDALSHVVGRAGVPVWLAQGLPGAWLGSGVGYVGDDRSPARAVVTCTTGPGPLGGGAELVLVAEEPGIGLGARHAGLAEPDPGSGFDSGPPDARVLAGGHLTALWSLPVVDDRAVFVGEALGMWLWAIVHPAPAGVVMYDEPALVDLRESALATNLEFGTVSARLLDAPAV
jgi:hypothetical protein